MVIMSLQHIFHRLNGRALPVIVCLGLLIGYGFPAYAAQVDETWDGGSGGWAAGSWSPSLSPGYPNNGVNGNTYNIFINSGGAVSLDVSPTIDNLTIASGGSVRISNGKALNIASGTGKGVVTNNGIILLYSEGYNTYFNGPGTTITGTGTLVMSNSANNFILTGINHATLTNDTPHTIVGSGSIGSVGNATTFTNLGTVTANEATPLILTAGVTNAGTLEAYGGTLRLYAAEVANHGGIIQGREGSAVEVSGGTTITGGTLAGTIAHTSGAAYLTDITNLGTYTIFNGAGTTINGTITNNGTITLGSSGSTTGLYMANALLTGTGTLSLSDSTGNVVLTGRNYARLTNDTLHTIEGSGSIGSGGHATTFTNLGTVRANQTTPLTLTAGVTNAGTLEAYGGTLRLYAAEVANHGGIIQGREGSAVEVSGGTTITGGTLAGTIAHTSGAAYLTDITNLGTYTIFNGAGTTINGTITNNGTITLGSSGSTTGLYMANALLTGTGTLSLSDSTGNVVLTGRNYARLTNDTLHTIEGSGSIGSGGHATTFTNLGTVRANQGTPLYLYGGATNNGTFEAKSGSTLVATNLTNLSGGTLTGGTYAASGTIRLPGNISVNAATILLDGAGAQLVNSSNTNALGGFASNSGVFTIKNGKNLTTVGQLSNTGTVTVGTGSSLSVGNGSAAYTQSAGATAIDGVLTAGSIILNGGTLSGNGVINAPVTSSLALAPGASPGRLTINGDYVQTAAGSLLIEIGGYVQGSEYDHLDVNGNAALAGTLKVDLWNGFAPIAGSYFDILTAGSIGGTFSDVITAGTGRSWSIAYLDGNGDSLTDTVRLYAGAPSSVPLPPSLLLLGFGLIGLIGAKRRVKKR
jgi:hypothetical protein